MQRLSTAVDLTVAFAMSPPAPARCGIHPDWVGNALGGWAMDSRRCVQLYRQGWRQQASGHCNIALRAFQEVLIRGRQTGHQGWIGAATSAIAEVSVHLQQNDCAAATPDLKPAAAVVMECCHRAASLYAEGDAATAIATYQRALALATRTEQPQAIARCLNNLGLIYLDQQRYELAESRLRAAAAVLADQDVPVASAIVHHNWGLVHFYQGRHAQAQTCFQKAVQHWSATADCLGLALTLDYLGRTYAQQQAWGFALASFEAAIAVLHHLTETADVREAAAALFLQVADLCEQTRHPDLAIVYWLAALALAPDLTSAAASVVIRHRLSYRCDQAGNTAIARHYRQHLA